MHYYGYYAESRVTSCQTLISHFILLCGLLINVIVVIIYPWLKYVFCLGQPLLLIVIELFAICISGVSLLFSYRSFSAYSLTL